MRLKDLESKGVEALLKRHADLKAFAQANGGRLPKDDGEGVEMRKNLTSLRSKLKIVKRKIKKFGATGKIPMGAGMRVYYEHSDSSSSE